MSLTCDVCGNAFEARQGARYCSGRCRTIAYRKRTTPDAKPAHRRPLGDGFRDANLDLYSAIRRLERLVDDDRTPRQREALAHYAQDMLRASDTLRSTARKLAGPDHT